MKSRTPTKRALAESQTNSALLHPHSQYQSHTSPPHSAFAYQPILSTASSPSDGINSQLSQRSTKRRRNRDTPPRPLNSFMIYRRDFQQKIKEQHPNILLSELSRISKSAAARWANEPQSVKQQYAEKAKREKELHMKMYPNYVYCPRRPSRSKQRKKSTSEGSSEKMSLDFLLNTESHTFRQYTPV